jgi:hypothetical protein
MPPRTFKLAILGLLALSLAACGSNGSSNPVKDTLTPLPTLEVQPEEVQASPPAPDASQTRSSTGLWLEPQPWPVTSIHATLLPPKDAQARSSVLTWGSNSPYLKAMEGVTTVDEFMPSSGTHTPTLMKSGTNGDMFGNGHAFTEDGDLFMAGGSQPANAIGHYPGIADAFRRSGNGTWSILPKMALERWYPTVTLLPNGEMLVSSGIKVQEENSSIRLAEVYQQDGTWRSLTGATNKLPALYPWLHVMPDGRVFNSGPQREMAILETAGTGSWTKIQADRDTVNRGYGSSVMFSEGKVLVMTSTITAVFEAKPPPMTSTLPSLNITLEP